MNRTAWQATSLVLIVICAFLARVEAQQNQAGAQASQEQRGEEIREALTEESMGQLSEAMIQQMQGMMQQMQGMMQQMHGRKGRGGMKGRGMMRDRADDVWSDGKGMMRGRGGIMGHMQRQLGRLTQQLELSDEQQEKVKFIPIKPAAAKGSDAPGSCAGHSRVPSPDRGYPSSTGAAGL